MARSAWRNYLFWCANEHVSFKIPEMESILKMFSIPHTWVERPAENPWMVISLPNEEYLPKIMSRSIMVRSCYELWAHAKTVDKLHEQLKCLSEDITKPFFGPEKSFKVVVDIFNKVISLEEKIEKIESFSYLPIEGPVNLKNPDVSLHYFEFFGVDPGRTKPDKPFDYFFGRRIIGESERTNVSKYSLKKRHFIGNTSMDPQLSMIMANMAQVQDGHVVVDPFVGSGSLLVAAAHFGGYVCGTDIDYLTLHGKSKPTRARATKRENENIEANLETYGLRSRYLDVFVSDASRPVWRPDFRFDSIITDPPYGIREPTEKVGGAKNAPIPEELASTHFPSKTKYGLDDIFRDLLNLAARRLKMHGRLVYWIPIVRMDYDPKLLPEHPCLELVANSEQNLTLHTSRRLITMEKVKEPEDDDADMAIIHNLPFTFRHKFLNGNGEEDPNDSDRRAREDELAKQFIKRSKKGNGVRQPDLADGDK